MNNKFMKHFITGLLSAFGLGYIGKYIGMATIETYFHSTELYINSAFEEINNKNERCKKIF